MNSRSSQISFFENLNKYLSKRLAEIDAIPILFDNAINFGNQAANVNLMRRLRKEGFRGRFQIYYPVDAKNKILHLLNEPERLEDEFVLPHLNMEFIDVENIESRFQTNQMQALPLGITGGIDYSNDLSQLKVLLDSYFLSPTNQTHFADFLNVDVFLRLYPYTYNDTQYDNRIYLKDDPNIIFQPETSNKALIVPVTSYDGFKTLISSTDSGKAFLQNYPGMETLISKLDGREIHFQPIYGWTLTEMPENLLNMILGTRYAQLHHLSPQPIVMAAFMDLDSNNNRLLSNQTTINIIKQLINSEDWRPVALGRNANNNNRVKQSIQRLKIREAFKHATLDNQGKQILEELKANDFLLLQLPQLAKDVFDGLTTYPYGLPFVREGASSYVNTLQDGYNTPHIRCRSNRPWEIKLQLAKPELQQYLDYFRRTICISTPSRHVNFSNWENENVDQLIGDYIANATNSTSELRQFFQFHKENMIENDRISLGLQAAFFLSELNNQPLNSMELPADVIENESEDLAQKIQQNSPNNVAYVMFSSLFFMFLIYYLFFRSNTEKHTLNTIEILKLNQLEGAIEALDLNKNDLLTESVSNEYYINKNKFLDIEHGLKKVKAKIAKIKTAYIMKDNQLDEIEDYLIRIKEWMEKLIIRDPKEIAKVKKSGRISLFYLPAPPSTEIGNLVETSSNTSSRSL